MKSIGNIAKYTLLALWLITIGILISIGIKQATAFAVNGRIVVPKEIIALKPTDTLMIKFRHNDYFAKNVNERNDFLITQDSTNTNVIYSNEVKLNIVKTDEKLPYIQVEKEAKGVSLTEAKKTADKIKYGYKLVGNQLILDNYFLTDFKNKYRDQEVKIFLYLPVGTFIKPDKSVQNYDGSDDEFFNLHYSSDKYTYKVESEKVKCLNCPADENEFKDVESTDMDDDSTSTSVIVNEKGILIRKKNDKEGDKKVKSIKINEDGVTIKTK